MPNALTRRQFPSNQGGNRDQRQRGQPARSAREATFLVLALGSARPEIVRIGLARKRPMEQLPPSRRESLAGMPNGATESGTKERKSSSESVYTSSGPIPRRLPRCDVTPACDITPACDLTLGGAADINLGGALKIQVKGLGTCLRGRAQNYDHLNHLSAAVKRLLDKFRGLCRPFPPTALPNRKLLRDKPPAVLGRLAERFTRRAITSIAHGAGGWARATILAAGRPC
jgi:hypothetical protein